MTDEERERVVAGCLAEHERRRARGEAPRPEDLREQAGAAYEDLVAVLRAESLLGAAVGGALGGGGRFGRASVVARLGAAGASADGGTGSAAAPAFVPGPEKYEMLAEIGAGGMGEVALVRDRDLHRDVAMKTLRPALAGDPAMRRRFVAEAQATSQLEHPGIPPVHDLGATPDGNVWFTMKVVRGRTLAQVLRDVLLGVRDARREFTLHRLATMLERIAEAVHFAHEKGVLHRDLKPENVMLGEFGEVHVMDWGIAKIGAAEEDAAARDDSVETVETEAGLATLAGTIKGTVPYMSPEQARGEAIDRRSDVYALGALLYEVLTLHAAFEGRGIDVLARVRDGRFPDVAVRNPRRPVPEALADLCRRAMARDRDARPATALEFGDALREWLDGSAERERRHREAEALAAQGREAMARYVAARDAIEGAERAVCDAESAFAPWQPLKEKAPLQEAREAVVCARDAAVLAFAEATKLLEAALLAERDHVTARAFLTDLWRGRLDEAERTGDRADATQALTMVRRYDDGRLAAYVAGEGTLELASDPPGARVALARFEDRHGMLVAGPERDLGATPFGPVPLAMGSYLCVLRRPGYRDVRYPVHVTRNREWSGCVRLRTDDEIGEGFVYVPGGPFVFGEGRTARVLEIGDFAIAERPVTFAAWATYLAAVEAAEGAGAAAALVPRTSGDGPLMNRCDDGLWRVATGIPSPDEAARQCAEHGADFRERWPVTGVSWAEAVGYCAWLARTTGRAWRLPTEEEWEKAARGVDGRRFPWGDVEDASLGKCRDSRGTTSQPEPVGAFPRAVSAYGVVDAAGGVWEWTDSWFDAHRANGCLRGGAWDNHASLMRCAMRACLERTFRYTDVGSRPARSLAQGGRRGSVFAAPPEGRAPPESGGQP